MSGRHTTYTDALAADLCTAMSSGQTMTSWCKKNRIGLSTVAQWRDKNPAFAEIYARARESQADALAEQTLDVADNAEIPADHKRIQVDTRKWFASKMRPRTYGDRQQIDMSGSLAVTQADPAAVMEQLVVLATTHPTMSPFLRGWAEQLIARLPAAPE